MKRYSFDLELTGAITIPANSQQEAETILKTLFDCADCNVGSFPNGDPATAEISLADGEWADVYSLFEVTDEAGNDITDDVIA